MRAFARFRLPDGSTRVLGHGDLIGRLASAALHLDDARISEAHAMVSLRGEQLKLLALRGRFAIGHTPVSEVTLEPDLVIQLARGLELVVEDVSLPEEILAIEGDQLARQVLHGTATLRVAPRPVIVPRYQGEGDAHLWSTGEGWRLQIHGEEPRALSAGESFEVACHTFTAIAVPLDSASGGATRVRGGVARPLRIVACFDTVHLEPEDEPVLTLGGIGARILSELVAVEGPMSWEALAREVWPDTADAHRLRRKLDVALARLRKKLLDARIRPDLIRADGTGNFELVLQEGDAVEDRT